VRTLNLAIPIVFLLGYTMGMVVYLICAESLIAAGIVQRTSEVIGGWLALFVTIAIALFVAHRRIRMIGAPTSKTESGHVLLAFANAAALLTTVVPMAASFIMNNPNIGHYMWFALPVFVVNLVLWPMGWARATSRAEADVA
jgi:hypothetical protein